MDPLSVSASILTILGSLNSGVHAANRLYKAPQGLKALISELAELTSVIHGIDDLSEDKLEPSLLAAKAVLLELEELICYRLTKVTGLTVDRLAWSRHKYQVDVLRDQLRCKRDTLTAMLAVVNAWVPWTLSG